MVIHCGDFFLPAVESRTVDKEVAVSTPKRPIFYGWVVLAVATFTMFSASMIRTSMGVFVIPMEESFGANRATISLAGTIFCLVFGMSGPIFGRFADRIGSRRVISGGFFIMGAGLLIVMTTSEIWQLYLWYSGIVALGFSAGTFITHTALLSQWFLRMRGTAVAAIMAGYSIGVLLLVQLITQATVVFGWQATAGGMGVFFGLVSAPLILIVVRNKPEDVDQLPDGRVENPGVEPATGDRNVSLSEAAKGRDFWLMVGGFFGAGFASQMVPFHLIPLSRDLGASPGEAAWSFAIIGVSNAAAALPLGWLADRYGRKNLLALLYLLRVGTLLFLAFAVTDIMGVYLFAALFGVTWANVVPPTTGLAADIFGRFSVGLLFGLIGMSHEIAGGIGTYLAGLIFVLDGSYLWALLLAAGLSAGAATATVLIREPAKTVAVSKDAA